LKIEDQLYFLQERSSCGRRGGFDQEMVLGAIFEKKKKGYAIFIL
jgi:hypothetical protein